MALILALSLTSVIAHCSRHVNQCATVWGRAVGAELSRKLPRLSHNSGSLAIFATIRRPHRASAVWPLIAAPAHPQNRHRRAPASWSRTTKQASCSSTVHGGGKRRAIIAYSMQTLMHDKSQPGLWLRRVQLHPARRRRLVSPLGKGLR